MNQLVIQRRYDLGEVIAKLLWPELELEAPGSFWDKQGIDGYLNGLTIQIKYDNAIARTGNLWHEIYEKSNESQPWRKSPGIATHYIFTTMTGPQYVGVLVAVDILALAEKDKPLKMIDVKGLGLTSMGFLVPLNGLRAETRRKFKEQV